MLRLVVIAPERVLRTRLYKITFLFLNQNQGYRNTMPVLSDLVPLNSGQIGNFYLHVLVLRQVQMYEVNKILYLYFDYCEITCCIENSVNPDL